MFYSRTLLKDGAFIMCEDASEYDENVPAVDNSQEIQKELVKEDKVGYNPVDKIYGKMKPYYLRLKDFYSYMSPPADIRTMVTNIETMSEFVSELVDKLRTCEVKISAMHHAASHRKFELEPLLINLGMLFNNKDDFIKNGYGMISTSFYDLRLIDEFNVRSLVNLLDNMGYGKKSSTIGIDHIITIAKWSNTQLVTFHSLEELFDKLFDEEYRTRIEQISTYNVSLLNIIDDLYQVDSIPEKPCYPYEMEDKHALINFASRQLRMMKIDMSDFILNCIDMDSEYAKNKYIELVRNVLVTSLDLFYLFMFDFHSKAYRIKQSMSARDCYSEYVKNIENYLRHKSI